MGRPMRRCAHTSAGPGRKCRGLSFSWGNRRPMYHRHSPPLTSWAATVASAAPCTPMENRVMSRMSSTMFTTLAATRK